jgi:hypothetical protein
MRADPTLDDLARRIRSRCEDSGGPYVLLLGAGCGKAAGVPTLEAIARDALATFGYDTPPVLKDEPASVVLSKFAAHTEKLSRPQLSRMLRSLYARVPVPSFYQDLALMVRERFFPIIVTANFDALLEIALDGVGLRSSDYALTTLGSPRRDADASAMRTLRPRGKPLTHIIKLHGDLEQAGATLTPDDIFKALDTSRSWIKGELSADLVMVGHEPGEPAVDAWLAREPDRELWWIHERPAPWPTVGGWSHDVHALVGDMGRPQIFFQQLALRLLRAPEAAGADAAPAYPSADEGLESVSVSPGDTLARGLGSATGYGGEPDSIADALQREILRSQSALTSLAQEGIPGARSPELQAQLQYQKKRLSTLEDRVRMLPEIRPQVLALADRLLSGIRNAGADTEHSAALSGVATYVDGEVGVLRRELSAESPNLFLVSASLGAMVTVADRLHTEYGDALVSASDLKALVALAPTSAGRVVP